MTALTSNFVGSVETVQRDLRPIAAGQITYQGHVCVENPGGTAPGYYGEATGAVGEVPVGRFYGQYGAVNNSTGAAGAVSADVQFFRERTLMLLNNATGSNALTSAQREQMVSIQDAITATLDLDGAKADLGVFYDFSEDGSGLVWVEFVYPSSAQDQGVTPGPSSPSFQAVGVATVIHAYTGTGTGTLTSTANGTLASQITTAGNTLAVGNVFFVPAGLTGLSGAVDSGPWQVLSLGAAGAKWSITRPSWWLTGSSWPNNAVIKISASDTIYTNTEWKAYNASGVVDTSDPGFYVTKFTFQATLTAGTLALSAGQPATAPGSYPLTSGGTHTMPVGIFSATESNILVTMAVPNTVTGAFAFGPTNASSAALCTPGYVGTAAGAVFATLAAMATATSCTSTVNVTVLNP